LDNEYLAHLHLAFFHPCFFRQLENRLPPFYSYCRIRNILSAQRHDNCIINLIEKGNIMSLVTFNQEQALDSFFDTDRFFGVPRTHEEQPTVLPKVNVIKKNDAFYLEAENPGMTQKDVSIEFRNGILTLKSNRQGSSQIDKNDYLIYEFRKQSFVRSFRIND
jgi:HSP20 family molecular chaperone IbpA